MMKEKKLSVKSLIVYLLVVVLSILQIVISNRLSNFGKKIDSLRKETSRLTLENEMTRKKIASSSSVVTLMNEAKNLGFNQKAEVIYLEDLYQVAQNSL